MSTFNNLIQRTFSGLIFISIVIVSILLLEMLLVFSGAIFSHLHVSFQSLYKSQTQELNEELRDVETRLQAFQNER